MRHGWLKLLRALLVLTCGVACYVLRGGDSQTDIVMPVPVPATATVTAADSAAQVQLCQYTSPAAPRAIYGVDSNGQCNDGCGEATWNAWRPIPWQAFAQGE